MFVVRGFLDLQINGAFGVDFTTEPERVEEVARQLPQFGITAFLPTVVSSPLECYPYFAHHLRAREVDGGATILGPHFEGPFLNPHFAGAHAKDYLIKGEGLSGYRLLTAAPEMYTGYASIAWGHTDTTTLKRPLMITHLFNTMKPFHHREPNLPAEVLTSDIPFSLIADGYHLSDATLRLAYRAAPQQVILVSDAMAGLGMPAGTYALGTQSIQCQLPLATTSKGALAGSLTSLHACMRHFRRVTGCSLHEVVEMVTTRPAAVIGHSIPHDHQVVLDEDLHLLETRIRGHVVWKCKDR